jgi:hypothetical protein
VSELKWLVVGLIILLLLIILITITKLTILISYHHSQDDDQLNIKVKAWFGLIRYKKSIPLIKIDDDSPAIVYKEKTQIGEKADSDNNKTKKFSAKDFIDGLHDMKQLLIHIVSLHRIMRWFLRKVSIKKMEWRSVIGVGDAATTGMLTGALWSVKGGLLGLISNYMRLIDSPILSITPSFQKAVSQTKFQCMIQFRIGYAMLAGIKLVKYWKGGRPKLQSKHLKFMSKDKSKSV